MPLSTTRKRHVPATMESLRAKRRTDAYPPTISDAGPVPADQELLHVVVATSAELTDAQQDQLEAAIGAFPLVQKALVMQSSKAPAANESPEGDELRLAVVTHIRPRPVSS